ncbi:MAG: hypothetical protein JWM05_3297 [Acidimicrobiales bacterium]|nr:hypothetical protein [Acidimicrobiales bacterium]
MGDTTRRRRIGADSAPTGPPTPADVLGVPFLPPGRATGATNRLRAALRRAHAGTAPPPVRILEGVFGLLDHRVLVALCQAGVPEALDRPMIPSALAATVGADPARLERLLRYGATRGWVRVDRRGRVRPTRITRFLRTDHPGGWRAWVEFAGGAEVTAAVANLSADPAVADSFAAANGAPFFGWMAAHPERWAVFDEAMAAGARMHALTLEAALSWPPASSVCDVGGGTGALLAGLLSLHPTLTGTVLDLPDVIARAVHHERLAAVAGDAFAAVPAGFDTYLLVNVLHDWGDDDAGQILATVAAAAGRGARVVVVDGDRRTVPRDELAAATDVLMAALTSGGRERDASAFAALGAARGLRLHRSVPLASGDLAHIFHPT